MNAFSARLNATEGSFFLTEQKNAVERHLQKLVDQRKLPSSALAAVGDIGSYIHGNVPEVPITVINSRPAAEVCVHQGFN